MKIAIGISHKPSTDSFAAGVEAATKAKTAVTGLVNLLIIFHTEDHHPVEVLNGIRAVVGDVSSIGGPAWGLICAEGLKTGDTVAIVAIHSSTAEFDVDYETGFAEDALEIGKRIGERILFRMLDKETSPEYSLLLLLIENKMDSDRLTAGITNVMGPFCQMLGGVVLEKLSIHGVPIERIPREGAITTCFIRSNNPIAVGVAHGWVPYSSSMVATHAEKGTIYTINGKPAYDMYRQFGPTELPPLNKNLNEIQTNFHQFAASFPIGLAQIGGGYLIRDPYQVNKDGSIECAGNIPEFSVIHLMKGESNNVYGATRNTTGELVQRLNGHPIAGALFFDCVARLKIPGFDFETEIKLVQQTTDSQTPVLGIVSLGEIGTPKAGINVFHNKVLTLGVFGGLKSTEKT